MAVRRFGQVIGLKPDAYEEYKRLHADVWDQVLENIHRANIRNYSIFRWNGYLFAYMEYIGDDYEADMAQLAADPINHQWWSLTDPLQQPVEGDSKASTEGNWWKTMEELFHTD